MTKEQYTNVMNNHALKTNGEPLSEETIDSHWDYVVATGYCNETPEYLRNSLEEELQLLKYNHDNVLMN